MTGRSDREIALERENEALRKALDASWRRAIEFPFPQVCKHYVAGVILDQMEKAGIETPTWVYEAVTFAHDARALAFDRENPDAPDPAPSP